MKRTAPLLLMILLFATKMNAQENFTNLWEKVHKFEVENLPKSALKVVEDIYAKAEKNNNSPQIVKTLFYKSKFALILEEDAQLKVINQFKSQIEKSSFPTKNVLQNVLANLHWQYFTQNRWKFYQRTKTSEKVDENDFRTWDLNTLFTEIHSYYEASLEEKLLLQKVDVHQFAAILHVVKGSKEYRSTLYDFLAHNALSFYKTPENNITKPAYQFTIDNANFLGEATTFSNLNLETKDSLSLEFNALKIYQDLIGFHLADKNPKALVDVDLQRLQFVKQHATFNNKEIIFLQTLKASQEKHKNNEESGLYAFEIAQIYHQQANSYSVENNTEHRFKNKKALAICNSIIEKFPESNGAKKCIALKAKIKNKSLHITSEKYVPINANSRLLINYKNIEKLNFSAYKINKTQLEKLNRTHQDSAKINFINKLDKVTSWNAGLRNENDFLQHTTEVIVPKMAQGSYLIIASESADLNHKSIFGTANIQVTNLALVEANNNEIYSYQIVDRNNGKPIKNASINLKNYNTSRYNRPINKNFTTDKNGFFSYKSADRHNQVVITVNHNNDTATFGDYYLYQHRDNSNKKVDDAIEIKPFIFTDRSIYRPGQTVYFKAIVLKKQFDKSEVFTNEYVKVILSDVNDQEVKTLELKLNEFGSVAGEFTLPNNGLTGEYSIEIEESDKDSAFFDNEDWRFSYDNEITISVEEYKRPKFKTEFKPTTETFKLNDSITINGFAKAFAGSNITDAKVVYRVHRKVQYPSWWYWRRPNFSSEAQEITHGENITDAKGEFKITFKAMPDESVSKESLPIFTYEISADVTDVNGETRSATTTVKVGYHALIAKLSIAQKINKNEKNNSVTITTENLNGEFVAAKGTLKIHKLQAPKNPLRKRSWNAPDYQDISETEFRKLFPHEPYTNDEADDRNWGKGKLVFEKKFDTEKSKEIELNRIKKWLSGNYIAIVESQDKFGKKVKEEARFTVFSPSEGTVADSKLFTINPNKNSYSVGENVELKIGSASKDITIIVQVERNHKIDKTHIIHLNNEIKTLKIPVKKEDIGGFAIRYHYVNYNDFDSGNLIINVSNKKEESITIETKTFRDKLQPGAEQTWSFTIKNDKNDKVAAEVLASMYDASLDEFKQHNWQFNPIQQPATYYSYNRSSANHSFGNTSFHIRNYNNNYYSAPSNQYDAFNWFGFYFGNIRNMMIRSKMMRKSSPIPESIEVIENDGMALDEVVVSGYATETKVANTGAILKKENQISEQKEKIKFSIDGIKIRKNLQETAFFFPQLQTDKKGNVSFNFTAPEALTRWKLQLLAHTKTLQSATKTLTTVTQKELMVVPNAPRFLREGDKIVFSSKISNLTEKTLNGFAQLQLTNAITGAEINTDLNNVEKNKNFTVDKNGNTNVSWTLSIPKNIGAIQYKVIAKAGDFSDGEQNALPVLTNRMLVTETLPMWIRSNQTKTFTLDKLKNNTSSTLQNHKLTLEMTSNPAWYAIQALPYLMEYPYECAEQTFSRYYANTLATYVANSNPKIQEVFNKWKSSEALLSNLEKNQELKSLIIQETPWLRDAQSETEQKKRIALLFDLSKMKNEQTKSINKLQEIQMNSGGFPWFKGGRYPSAFITNHIASGFGHLQKLGVTDLDKDTRKMLDKAVQFLDEEIVEKYDDLLKRAAKIKAKNGQKKYEDFLKQNHLSYFALQYLYMRSFYVEKQFNKKTREAVDYYTQQSATYWNDYNLYAKGQIALIQYRTGEKSIANKIVKSLEENSITSDELGMYWKENTAGYYYYQAPVETQALMIETFSEIKNDINTIDNLKIWLLKNKQTNQWKTTKATSEAVYALLLNGSDWISITDMVDINLGDIKIEPSKMKGVAVEAGTGYFKTSWNAQEITPKMADVTIAKKGSGIAWGGLYWQYFEDLDKITSAETPLKLNKKLFLKVNSDTGKELQEIKSETTLNIGDLVTVRIELKVDREMEFIHMKDMRASGVEPINVLSQYKWQDGLGYYESTKDAATNFFFDRLPKGVYVFEYDVRVNNAGNFSNGITTIQSMYAPEFSSNSKGIRINVK
ncbi:MULTISPECIES: alpha-2-macroglobulin family protein [Tenacibaculum]|uniref:alpha-2-macroglobulin family protein n=1 Tax=Tenacibaculum TaxID=104267 RepID=UPI001F0A3038|nr:MULTISPECIES: MG2 domain-containing protein [Tenacibaculum]MCH3881853.1 MG2 domain-containing protein [Tenacibaculum aquimarinum]MDO6598578.1 MG2 domain-containing protein [Tenacibaculum sp. 1_MG-2023]